MQYKQFKGIPHFLFRNQIFTNLAHVQLLLQIGHAGIQPMIFLGFGILWFFHIYMGYMLFILFSHSQENHINSVLFGNLLVWLVAATFGIDKTLSCISHIGKNTDIMRSDLANSIPESFRAGQMTIKVFSRKVKSIRSICIEGGIFENRLIQVKISFRISYMESLLTKVGNALISFPINNGRFENKMF